MFASRTRPTAALAAATVASVLVLVPNAALNGKAAVDGSVAGGSISACQNRPTDAVLAAQIGETRALALARMAAADRGRTDRFPHAALEGATSWSRRPPLVWSAGFYPGSLWQAYGWTRDPLWLERARKWTAGMLGQATNTTTHDLGFMLDTNAGRGASMDATVGARAAYADTTLSAARSLATRWNPSVGLFQVGTKDGEWFVIVDSAMNADLLFHGAQLTTDPDEAGRLRAIAHQHLLTLARDFVRTDGSTRHLLVYNPETGELIGERDGAGYSTSTTWARGQAWAIYGFAMGYRRTGDDRLLAAARATADYWLARIGADCVPRWDFDAPDDSPFQDSSAAAVAASGLFDLAAIEPDTAVADGYRSTALSITAALTTAAYTTAGTNHPAVLRRQTYQIARVPAPTEGSYSWGDHYLLEAMTKSLRLLNVSPQLQLSAPARVRYGDTVAMRVTGTLPGGAPAAGIPLTLQRRAQGTPSWVTVATGTTGFRGRASFTVRPTGGGQLRVLSGAATTGVARFTPAVSTARTISVSVRAALTFAGRYSDKYVLSMPYVAAPSGTRFALQEKLGSGWATVSTVRWLPRTSTKRRLVSSSRYFRVVPLVPAATGVVGVVSSTVTVPRR